MRLPQALACVCISLASALSASEIGTKQDQGIQSCMACHVKPGLFKRLGNNEEVALTLDLKAYQASVHGSFACQDCHARYSTKTHPIGSYSNREELSRAHSNVCTSCHSLDQLKALPVHQGAFKSGRPVLCSSCHGAHEIQRVVGGGARVEERAYCLSCHEQHIEMVFENKETKDVYVELRSLLASPHSSHACSDCHVGFSRERHPERSFQDARYYSLVLSETCKRCHYDKYTRTLDSMHYKILMQGNANAPVCTDCHGSHAILPVGKDHSISAKRCMHCHEAVYSVYAKSVHGKTLLGERNPDVPVCADCHKAHEIQDPRTQTFREQIPEMCGNCHANKGLMARYGLSPSVVETYLEDFHGVTLSLYKIQRELEGSNSAKPIAVCTDCHGIHDIQKVSKQQTEVVRKNLLKRCQACHPGASIHFPNAWLYHYEPSLKKAPLVYAVNLFYSIFIPFMVVGLLLQVFLHAWRYIVNR